MLRLATRKACNGIPTARAEEQIRYANRNLDAAQQHPVSAIKARRHQAPFPVMPENRKRSRSSQCNLNVWSTKLKGSLFTASLPRAGPGHFVSPALSTAARTDPKGRKITQRGSGMQQLRAGIKTDCVTRFKLQLPTMCLFIHPCTFACIKSA